MSSQKPTILHVIDTTGPGGAETVFTQLAAACNQLGYRSLAVIRGPGWVEEQLKKNDIEYRVIDCKGSFNIRFLMSLIQVVRKEKAKVIQSHLLGSNVYSSLAGILTRTPVISTFHGHVDVAPNEKLRRTKFSIIAIGSRKIVAVTNDLRNNIIDMGIKLLNKKTSVIANGIDEEIFSVIDRTQLSEKPANKIVFGSLGNIREAKNYFLAVDFVAYLLSVGWNVELRIAGDNTKELGMKLNSYIQQKGLDNEVSLLGFIDNVPGFFAEVDVFLMTSSTEGHPLALTQALAASVPVLTTPSGVEEIVKNGEQAFIADEHSVEALSKAFESLKSKSKEDLRNILANGRELVIKEYSLTAMSKKYASLYVY